MYVCQPVYADMRGIGTVDSFDAAAANALTPVNIVGPTRCALTLTQTLTNPYPDRT